MLSSQMLCPRLWRSCVAFIGYPVMLSFSHPHGFDFRWAPRVGKMGFIRNAADGIASDQKLFVRRNDERVQSGITRTDPAFECAVLLVPVVIELQPCPFETCADVGPDLRLVLSNPSGEDHRVGPSHAGQECPNVF